MVAVEEWTGREAVLLQAAMRESIRSFAERLGISPRTVTKWRKGGSAVVCRPEMQQILDAALATCSPDEREAFNERLDSAGRLRQIPDSSKAQAGGPYSVVSHKFLPVYVSGASESLFEAGQPHPTGPGGLTQRVLDAGHPTAQTAALHVFACGVAVVHLEELLQLESLTDLAIWRYRSYLEDRAWAGQRVTELLDHHAGDGASVSAPEYVLSAYELREHSWTGHGLETALQLLTTPSVLVNREDESNVVPLGPGVEGAKFAASWAHPEAITFGGGVSRGVAGWSGVAYHPQTDERALTMSDIVALELDAQALWALSSHILRVVEDGQDPVMPDAFGWRWLRGAYSRLTAARPTETAQHRVMREAILATSELPDRLRAAQEALRDSNP